MRPFALGHVRRGLPAAGESAWSRVPYVLELALPSAGEQLLSMLVGLVDTFLVGHLGAAPLAAVGLANQWIMFAMVLFSAVGTGATALIARMVGAGDMDTANRVLRQAMLLALAVGAVMTAAIEIWAEPAMVLMGADAETVGLGVTFLTIAGSAYVFSALMFIGNACLRGAGDTRTPLWVMLIVNGINIVVAWVLVNGVLGFPRLGVAGSATGAMLGRLVGGLLVVFLLWRGRSGLCLRSGRLALDVSLVRRILRVGVPTGVEQLIFRLGMMSYVRVVAALGTIAYAAHQVAINAESLSYMPGFGFAVAATTLVGQGLGARDPERAERDGFIAFAIGAGIMTIMGICFIIFARPIVSFFTSEAEVIAAGAGPLRLVGFSQLFLASSMIFAGALRGAGDTRAPMLINGASVWGVRVPLALLFTQVLGAGLIGAWIAMVIDLGIRGTLMFTRFQAGKWKTVEV